MRCIWNSMGYSTEASITRCFLHNCWYLTGAVIEITMGLVMLGNSCSPVTRLERLSDSMGVITGHHGAAGSPRFYQRMVSHHFPVGAATAGRDLHHSLLFRRNTLGSNLPPAPRIIFENICLQLLLDMTGSRRNGYPEFQLTPRKCLTTFRWCKITDCGKFMLISDS